MLQETSEGIIFSLKVSPKAHRNEIVGWENEILKIRIAAVPEDGEANRMLVQFLAKHLDISKSQIQLIFGSASRHKRVRIIGITSQDFLSKLSKKKS